MDLVSWFSHFPKIPATFIAAFFPVTELRGSIPLAISVWHIDPFTACVVSILGGCLPIFIILFTFDPIQRWLSSHSRFFARFFDWLYAHTRRRFETKYQKYGVVALGVWAALPIPLAGTWSGALAAWLFGVKRIPAIISMVIGTTVAGIAVTIITIGVLKIF